MRQNLESPLPNFVAGFTLIEILLTLAIMSVLSIFGIVTYREYNQSKIVESAAQDIQDTLVLARSRASTQVKPEVTACAGTRPLYGYQVRVCPSNCTGGQDYQLSVVCGTTGQYTQVMGEAKRLPTGVTFGSQLQSTLLFRVLTGEVVGGADIVVNGFGSTRTISVSQTGVVSVMQ